MSAITRAQLTLPADPLLADCGWGDTAERAVQRWLERERRLHLLPISTTGQLLVQHHGVVAGGLVYTRGAVLQLVRMLWPQLERGVASLLDVDSPRHVFPHIFNPLVSQLAGERPLALSVDPYLRLILCVSDSALGSSGHSAEFWHAVLAGMPRMAWDGFYVQASHVLLAVRRRTELCLCSGMPCHLGLRIVLRRRLQSWSLTGLSSYVRLQHEGWTVGLTRGKLIRTATAGGLAAWLHRQEAQATVLARRVSALLHRPEKPILSRRNQPAGTTLLEQLRYLADEPGEQGDQLVFSHTTLSSRLSHFFLRRTANVASISGH